MRRAIYGGSFNPVHNDHIRLARSFCEQFCLDRVTLIPTNVTPLKDNAHIVDGAHRYRMCKLAVQDDAGLEVSDIELRRQGMSYTSDTIAQLKSPGDELFLIVGADMYVTLDRWHNAAYIFDSVTILAAPRGPLDYHSILEKYNEYRERFGCRTLISHEPVGPLSSTDIRARIAAGEDVSGMLDHRVLRYIQENGLYR